VSSWFSRIVKEQDDRALLDFVHSAGAPEDTMPKLKAMLQEDLDQYGPVDEAPPVTGEGSPLAALRDDAIEDAAPPRRSRLVRPSAGTGAFKDDSDDETTSDDDEEDFTGMRAAEGDMDGYETSTDAKTPRVFGTMTKKKRSAPVDSSSSDDTTSSSSSSDSSSGSDSDSGPDSDSENDDSDSNPDEVVPFAQDPANRELIRKYRKLPTTPLDAARDRLYETDHMFGQAQDEDDLEIMREDR
jgi:cobalamin biosynthesis protein CobT